MILHMDNKSAVAYVHCQGGTRSLSLLAEMSPIMSCAQRNLLHLSAVYIPAPSNFLADTLSHKMLNSNEWSLDQSVFALDMQSLGISGSGFDGDYNQNKVQTFSFQSEVSRSGRGGYTQLQVGVQAGICLSSGATDLQTTQ